MDRVSMYLHDYNILHFGRVLNQGNDARGQRVVSSFGAADCAFRMMVRNIALERRRRLILAALDLNRYDFRSVLNQEVNLTAFV